MEISLTSDGKYLKSPVPGDERNIKKVSENSGSEVDNLFTDLNLNV